jgi:excisionase family DNA binding protein
MTIAERLSRLEQGITARELARLLGVSPVSIYRAAARQALPSYKLGTSLRFDGSAVATALFGEN